LEGNSNSPSICRPTAVAGIAAAMAANAVAMEVMRLDAARAVAMKVIYLNRAHYPPTGALLRGTNYPLPK
jgi:hypothetical protein